MNTRYSSASFMLPVSAASRTGSPKHLAPLAGLYRLVFFHAGAQRSQVVKTETPGRLSMAFFTGDDSLPHRGVAPTRPAHFLVP